LPRRFAAPLFFIAWACLTLWPAVLHPGQPLAHPKSQFSDLLISHWPNAEFLRRSLFEFHQFPLWNPSILGGAPFAADPLAGLWYPPNWLTVILPLPFAFNFLLLLHLAWAGWGMYRWARADGFGVMPALVGGLAFAAMPKLIAHIGAGHVSLAYAVAWTPWIMRNVECRTQSLSSFIVHRSSLAWAMCFLADARWGVYAGVVMAAWWLARDRSRVGVRGLGICITLFLLLTAVLWLPMLEFVRRSSRTALTMEEAGVFSLPANHLIGLLAPDLGGFQEYMTYLGIAPLAFALSGAGASRNRVGILTMIMLALISTWWALGPSAGLFTWFARAPGLTLLRVPSRAWFIVGLAVSWLAVRGAAAVEEGWRLKGRAWNLASVGLIAAAWTLALGGSAVAQRPLGNLFATAFAITGVMIALRLKPALPIMIAITAIELLIVNSTLIESWAVAHSPIADWLKSQPGVWRVYSPSYSLTQLDAAQAGIEQADGVNPIQLRDTATFMEAATGVARTGYSVTLPPFNGEVATANADAVPSAGLLGAMNVRFVLSEFDIDAEGLELQEQIGDTRIYRNTFDGGRVNGGELVSWSPNRIVIAADGSGRVRLAEVWYPGWAASVDGVPAVVEGDGIFRSVTAGEGSREIVFEFRPVIVWIGLALSLIGLLVSIALFRWPRIV